RAGGVVDAGGVRTPTGRAAIAALDRELRNERNARNPGATADLTGAAIYVVLLEGGWGERRERAADGRAYAVHGRRDERQPRLRVRALHHVPGTPLRAVARPHLPHPGTGRRRSRPRGALRGRFLGVETADEAAHRRARP